MLFAAGIISSDFNNRSTGWFSKLIAENRIFENKDLAVSATGRVTGSIYQKSKIAYFDFEIKELKVSDTRTGRSALLKKCGTIFTGYKSNSPPSFYDGDFIKIDIDEIQEYTGNNGKTAYIFFASKTVSAKDIGFASFFYAFKSRIHNCIRLLFFKNLTDENAKTACAVILGDQARIPMEITESFKKSGIYHLIAISGLHISIMAAFIFFFLKKLRFPQGIQKILISSFIIAFLVFYNLIVGEKASMLRASVMFTLVLFSKDMMLDYRMSNILLISYTVLLAARPGYLENAGFILSFASIAALVYMVPVVKKLLDYFLRSKNITKNYFVKSMIAAFAVNLMILPVLASNFGGFSLISIFTNIAAAPVFYILLLNLFIASIGAIFWFGAGSFLIMPVNFLMGMIIKLSAFFASLPFGYINTLVFKDSFAVFLYYAILAFVFISASIFLKKEVKNNIKNIV
jgi:competence protein ComEC